MKETFKKLLEKLMFTTRKSAADISLEMGYKKNYISEMLSPGGKVSTKFMNAFKSNYREILENQSENPILVKDSAALIINNQIELMAGNRIILSILSEVQAAQLKRLPTELAGIYRDMVASEALRVREELRKQKL